MPRKRPAVLLALAALCVMLVPRAYAEPRILLVGDSWAAGILHFEAFPKVFAANGLDDVEAVGATTALGGTRADQWASNHRDKLDILTAALDEHPSIDIVHLSIGGNDFLRHALENDLTQSTEAERAVKWDAICADIRTFTQFILEHRPGIRVLLNDYDFLDPAQMGKTLNMVFKGDPTAVQLNTWLLELGARKRALADSIEGVYYIHHFGLMQYHYGIPGAAEPKTVPYPGPAPDYVPFPGGDINHPSPVLAMPDGVHPTPEGYTHIIANCFDQFYKVWLAETPAAALAQ